MPSRACEIRLPAIELSRRCQVLMPCPGRAPWCSPGVMTLSRIVTRSPSPAWMPKYTSSIRLPSTT